MEELIKQAEQGNAEAQYQLGLAYYNGDGKTKTFETDPSFCSCR